MYNGWLRLAERSNYARQRGEGKGLYVELTAHLIDREIAKFRRGEQATLVSFASGQTRQERH